MLVVDDHPLLRQGIAALLAAEADMQLVAEAADVDEAVRQFEIHQPDVTLMDLQLQRQNGVDAISAIRARRSDARIIVLTTFTGDARILRALQAGASGYLLKTALRKELLDAIRRVHAGHRHITADAASELAEHAGDRPLTPREADVLRLVAAGRFNKEIAGLLSISEGTVKEHLKNIMSKLAADDRTHAVAIALKRGIIEL